MEKGISFVIPAFNEVDNITGMLNSCVKTASSLSIAYEIIVIDDGSTDGTSEAVSQVQSANPEIVLLKHDENMGIAQATRYGFATARFEHVFYTDADAQFDPEDLKKLLPFAHQYDFVVGYRVCRADPVHRKINAWLYNICLRLLFRIPLRDVDCALKLIRTESLRSLNAGSKSAFYFAELVNAAALSGMTFHEIPVRHFPRRHGVQTGAKPKVVFKAMFDLLCHALCSANGRQ